MSTVAPLLLRHLLLTGVGTGIIVLLALSLRTLVRRDAVLSYRVMVTALLVGVALCPLQLLIAEFSTQARAIVFNLAPGPVERMVPEQPHDARFTAITPRSPTAPSASASVLPLRAARGDDGAAALLAAYLVGVALVLGSHVRGLFAARCVLARSRLVADPRVLRIWASLVADMRRPPILLECDSLHAPACRVLGRAAVILPSRAAGGVLDDDTLAASLRHEIVHLARRDGLIALFAALANALVWFQPLVWIFVRILRIDREQSCDAIVVRTTGRPHAYAQALLRFCDPYALARRSVPLIGFESAQTVRRRITMLSHALHPATRSRRAAMLAAGLAGVTVTFAAHGFFTVAAAPGSLLSDKSAARTSAEPAEQGSSPRMNVEVRAPDEGRSDARVYERIMELQHAREHVQGPGGLIQKPVPPADRSLAFFLPDAPPPKVYPPGTWVTDEEPILSATDARIEGDLLRARSLRLRLPGGSKLRAEFEGRMVKVEQQPDQHSRILVTGGSVNIVDESGATRLRIRADRDDQTLIWTAAPDAGKSAFDISAADATAGLSVQVDSRTGVPEGEQQPPHGAIRWKLVAPQTGGGAIELRMQWIYDLSEVRNPVGC